MHYHLSVVIDDLQTQNKKRTNLKGEVSEIDQHWQRAPSSPENTGQGILGPPEEVNDELTKKVYINVLHLVSPLPQLK